MLTLKCLISRYVDVDLGDFQASLSNEFQENGKQGASSSISRSKHKVDYLPKENGTVTRSSQSIFVMTIDFYSINGYLFDIHRETMPLDRAGIFSVITYSWLTKYMNRAYEHGLRREDIPLCSSKDSCAQSAQRFSLFLIFKLLIRHCFSD